MIGVLPGVLPGCIMVSGIRLLGVEAFSAFLRASGFGVDVVSEADHCLKILRLLPIKVNIWLI